VYAWNISIIDKLLYIPDIAARQSVPSLAPTWAGQATGKVDKSIFPIIFKADSEILDIDTNKPK